MPHVESVNLSLSEAAAALGKSTHQVRYLLRKKRLKGSKESGQWVIRSSDLPLTEDQRRGLAERLETARQAFEKGLEPITKASDPKGEPSRRHYSVTDLIAYQAGLAIHREAVAFLGADDSACRRLAEALVLLAQGCHSFHPTDKAGHFTAARNAVAAAVTETLLPPEAEAQRRQLVERMESELLPKVAGLVARQEKRSRGRRHARFGSFSQRYRD